MDLNHYDNNIINKVKKNLTPDLLHKKYNPIKKSIKSTSANSKNKNVESANLVAGHCYVASEAIYHLLGKKVPLVPWYMKIDGQSHWFLAASYLAKIISYPSFYIYDNELIDITADQFKTKPNYTLARPKGFLTKEPCKRTKILIDRVINEGEI